MDWIGLTISIIILGVFLFWFKSRASLISSKRKDLKNDLQEEKVLKEVFQKAIVLFEENQYYLNKNIKVSDMATELGFNEKMVSKAINKYGNGNFNHLINTYRIGYAKELIEGGKYNHYTIEAIAEEVGFSNKVSFYNAFKSDTGMSPKQFKALKHS